MADVTKSWTHEPSAIETAIFLASGTPPQIAPIRTVLRHPKPGEVIVDHRGALRVARRKDRHELHYVVHVSV